MINSSKIILSEISWISNTFEVHFFTICAFEGYGPEKKLVCGVLALQPTYLSKKLSWRSNTSV